MTDPRTDDVTTGEIFLEPVDEDRSLAEQARQRARAFLVLRREKLRERQRRSA